MTKVFSEAKSKEEQAKQKFSIADKKKNYDTAQSNSRMAAIGKVPPSIIGQHCQLGHRICLLCLGKHVDKV